MAEQKSKKTKSKISYCLVRWTEEDEQVSVIPASTVKPGQEVYVEAVCEFKWLGRYFEAEVLKVSGQPTIVSKH